MVLTLNNVTEAMKGERLSARKHDDIKEGIGAIMRNLSILSGFDPDLVVEQLDDLTKDLANGFPMLTLDEVKLAGKAGIAGEFGGTKKPSYSTMMQWTDAYHRSPMVADARKIRKNTKTEPKRTSPEEGWRIFVTLMPQALARRWEDIRTKGRFGNCTIPHVSAQLYDWLGEGGVLRLTEDQKRDAANRGTAEVKNSSVWDMTHIESGKTLIRSRTKHYALEIWMQDIHRNGGTLPPTPKITRLYD
ncbi:MAG: hypothetical protein IK076_00125 [Bacteroidales bacterium]|nr:hypothetical protein [Bacteroidales bacterium]